MIFPDFIKRFHMGQSCSSWFHWQLKRWPNQAGIVAIKQATIVSSSCVRLSTFHANPFYIVTLIIYSDCIDILRKDFTPMAKLMPHYGDECQLANKETKINTENNLKLMFR